MKKHILYILLSVLLSMLFTVVIYNFEIALAWLTHFYENRVLIYAATVVFFYFLYLFLRKKLPYKTVYIFLICTLAPIIMDATSIELSRPFANMDRFPFASIFPLLGAGLAYVKTRFEKPILVFSMLGVFAFLIFSYFLISNI